MSPSQAIAYARVLHCRGEELVDDGEAAA